MTKSKIEVELETLRDSEVRDFPPAAPPPEVRARAWYTVHQTGEIPFDIMVWENAPSLPLKPETYLLPAVGFDPEGKDLHFSFRGKPEGLRDVYAFSGWNVLLSEKALDVVHSIDPNALEAREAQVSGTARKFFLGRANRSIKDAIAIDRTHWRLRSKLRSGHDNAWLKWVEFPARKYEIRADLTASIACFTEYFSGRMLWSSEVVKASQTAKLRHVRFVPCHSTDLREEVSL